jgi:hypothetical protein
VKSCFLLLLDCSGGDADQIEEEYHQLAGNYHSEVVDSPIRSNVHSGIQTSGTSANSKSSIQDELELQQPRTDDDAVPVKGVPAISSINNVVQGDRPVVLTDEQRAMIEAKRLEALRRRQLRLQQKSAPVTNPYAK